MKYTKEQLQNTYGRVHSKEHADYIIGIAESIGVYVHGGEYKLDDNWFFIEDYMYFCSDEYVAKSSNETLIDIPMPDKEWPQVGDEVVTIFGVGIILDGPDLCGGYCTKVEGVFLLVEKSDIKKTEEPIVDQLHKSIIDFGRIDPLAVSRMICDNYEVKRK